MLDKILNFDGTYISKLQNYFKAMNKTLWSGVAKDGEVLTISELTNYDVIAIRFELSDQQALVERTPGSNRFRGSVVMTYPTWVALQDIELISSDGVSYRIDTSHNSIQDSGLQPESTQYGIKTIVGVMPTPEKFGLGGVLRSILYALSPRKEMVLC